MPQPWLDMIKEAQQLLRQIEKSEFSKQWIKPLADLWNAPRVEVVPEGKYTRVWIEAPGLTPSKRKNWAVKVQGDQLFLRGTMSAEHSLVSDFGGWHKQKQSSTFTKLIPMPYEVKPKPVQVEYENGVLSLLFERKQARSNDQWQELRF